MTSCLVGLPLSYWAYFQQSWIAPYYVLITVVSFYVSTLFFSPDIDLRQSIPTKNWGFFKFIWFAYPYFFKHRGKSHSFWWSSSTKILYLVLTAGATFTVLQMGQALLGGKTLASLLDKGAWLEAMELGYQATLEMAILVFSLAKTYRGEILAAGLGMTLSDWVHITLDYAFSRRRKASVRAYPSTRPRARVWRNSRKVFNKGRVC